jgi:tetratricopeptide (TPR) repeat protein
MFARTFSGQPENYMKSRIATMLLFALLALALWRDLARFINYLGEQNYRRGNFVAACNYWQTAARISGDVDVARFNIGVARYRMGAFSSAASSFTAVKNGKLRYKYLYNAGNSLARRAEECAASNVADSKRYYEAALEHYRSALLLNPGDQDIQTNLNIVAIQVSRHEHPHAGTRQPKAKQSGESTTGTQQRATPRNVPAAVPGTQGGQPATNNQDAPGRRRKAMGREQAERILNEKRGQEALVSATKAAPGGASMTRTEKDW